MGIAQGVGLGLEISRGARAESRKEAEHKLWLQRQAEDAQHQARLRPMQLKEAQLGLSDLESSVQHNRELRPLQLQETKDSAAHNAKLRPLQLQESELGLAELQATAAHNKSLRPLELQSQRLGVEAGRFELDHAKKRDGQADADRAETKVKAQKQERLQRVQEMAPIEYARFQRTGKFSDTFLRESADTPLSPFHALDPAYTDALTQAKNYFDPRNQQANPYADGKVFEVANVLLKQELNNGGVHPQTGKPIVDKKIVGVRPAVDGAGQKIPGKMFVELEMTDEDGNTYRAPVTQSRSSNPDDPLQPMDFGQFVGRINAQSMFANAVQSNPEGVAWLKARSAQLSSGDAKGKRALQSDEIQWAGRPQKTDSVYKRFKENPAFGDAEAGVQYVSLADYEWTQGEPDKLKFLEGVAKENKVVMQEYQRLRSEGDTEEAEKWLQEKYIDDPEALFSLQSQKGKNSNRNAVDGKSQQLVDKITADKPATEQAPEDPNWFLADGITKEQVSRMTPEQASQRIAHLKAQRQQEEAKQIAARKGEQRQIQSDWQKTQEEFNAGAHTSLKGAERQQWIKNNIRNLTPEQRQVVLGNQ
jgi:hypothetical protein